MSLLSADGFFSKRRFPPPATSDALQAYLCVFCQRILDLDRPHQSSCGDRACYTCLEVLASEFKQRGIGTVKCPGCQQPIQPSEFFLDRAVARELKSITVTCPNGCQWSDLYQNYQDHLQRCPLQPISCPHSPCPVQVARKEIDGHIVVCLYRPVTCKYCNKMMFFKLLEMHETNECERKPVPCPLCGVQVALNAMELHQQEECTKAVRACPFAEFGCDFKGLGEEVIGHEQSDVSIHVRLVGRGLKSVSLNAGRLPSSMSPRSDLGHIETAITHIEERITKLTSDFANLMADFQKLKMDTQTKYRSTEEATPKVQVATKELQDYYSELALSMQTMQASSYGSVYIWKIPEFTRRRRDAALGKTISLYSAPFYTSRHGYKLCMRVYLNGDGAGRGTHISLFVCLMKGDFDPLLPWPFRQTITLVLLSQDPHVKDIKQSFKPDGDSSSFRRPVSEMNVASGCPQFCSLDLVNDPAYLRNDTLYLKASINTRGIEHLT